MSSPAPALQHQKSICDTIKGSRLALFLDYDGTLTPIVRRPEDATLAEPMRALLRELAEHHTLGIVSGRDRKNVEGMVGLDNIVYAGSHGFDIRGPDGMEMQHEQAKRVLPALHQARAKLEQRLAAIEGARLEPKRFALAVHYREVTDESDVQRVEELVDEVQREHSELRKKGGKKIFELQPDVPWDKGEAVLWLRQALGLDGDDVITIYIGDDVTDEDAFRALRDRQIGVGIRVGRPEEKSDAYYYINDCDEVYQFLQNFRAL